METVRKWNPVCITQGTDENPGSRREMGHSALGYITPCCWADPEFFTTSRKESAAHGYDDLQEALFTEDLKIANNDNIEDILFSEAWANWYEAIRKGGEDAPLLCQRYCYRVEPHQIVINER